jgi:hypothetical protein
MRRRLPFAELTQICIVSNNTSKTTKISKTSKKTKASKTRKTSQASQTHKHEIKVRQAKKSCQTT